MAAEKPHMNLVFIGHVDAGKSTLVGRVLYETGAVSEEKLRKLKDEAGKLGKATFEFAYVMDRLKEERERGLTIDLAYQGFQTQNIYFTIIDAPGHQDFVKNMITGASQADAAVLVVATPSGVQPQTKEHVFLAKTLGINQLVVAMNKMDAINYDESKYNTAKADVSKLLQMVGFKPDEVPFIPVSAFNGDNVKTKSDKTPWYKGPIFLEAIDKFKPPEKPTDKPLRLPIQDVYTITGIGTVPVGRVETGIMKPGQKVVVEPSGVTAEVKSIEMHHTPLEKAMPGDNVGFNLRGVEKKSIKRGDVLGDPNNPPAVAQDFTAQVVVLQHPTAITVGYTPVVHCHTAQVSCSVIEIVEKKDPKTGETLQKNPDFIKTGDVAIVKFKPVQPLVVEVASEYPQLGRFAIRDMGMTVAAGMVTAINKRS